MFRLYGSPIFASNTLTLLFGFPLSYSQGLLALVHCTQAGLAASHRSLRVRHRRHAVPLLGKHKPSRVASYTVGCLPF